MSQILVFHDWIIESHELFHFLRFRKKKRFSENVLPNVLPSAEIAIYGCHIPWNNPDCAFSLNHKSTYLFRVTHVTILYKYIYQVLTAYPNAHFVISHYGYVHTAE